MQLQTVAVPTWVSTLYNRVIITGMLRFRSMRALEAAGACLRIRKMHLSHKAVVISASCWATVGAKVKILSLKTS